MNLKISTPAWVLRLGFSQGSILADFPYTQYYSSVAKPDTSLYESFVCVCVAAGAGTNQLVSQERLKGRDFGVCWDRVFLSVSLLLKESVAAAAAAAAPLFIREYLQ
jgi:hypothetical protein